MNVLDNLKDLIENLPVISYGVRGGIVKSLQTTLSRLGYYHDGIDGYALVNTVKAIKQFQTDNNLTVDGFFGQECWNKLLLEETDSPELPEEPDKDMTGPLTKEECDDEFDEMDTPSLVDIVESGKSIGLDDTEIVALIAWVDGEGYWGVGDPYLGYLSGCVVINCILDGWWGRGDAVVKKIASWGPYYSEDKQIARYTEGVMNDRVLKTTYLALTHLQTGVHCCYGPDKKPEKIFYDPDLIAQGKNVYVW